MNIAGMIVAVVKLAPRSQRSWLSCILILGLPFAVGFAFHGVDIPMIGSIAL